MRRVSLAILIVILAAAVYAFSRHHFQKQITAHITTQQDAASGRRVLYYVDPMHPAYRSDKPGIAPDCGMQLEPVWSDGPVPSNEPNSRSSVQPAPLTAESATSSGSVTIDGATQKLIGLRVAAVQQSGGARILRVVGRATPEDTNIYTINSGVDGFVRETFHDSVGSPVKKNQKLATYYAPDFIAAASGFLAAHERVAGALAKEGARSIQNYTDRLRNLGMSDVQIDQMAETHQLPDSIDVVAPTDGFILSRSLSAGQHFMREAEFYRIADLRKMWVAAEIDEQDAALLRPGILAELTLKGEGQHLQGHVTDSLPQSETGGGTVKLRLEVNNPRFLLRPEMLVDVELPVRVPAALTIPADALIDSGSRARVYVQHGAGTFEPREVQTGWRYGERVEILRGLQPGEQVVSSATFLVDSESRLKAPVPSPSRTSDHRSTDD